MKTHRLLLLFSISLVARGLRAEDSAPPGTRIGITPDFINRLVGEARERNPALDAAAARAEAASDAVDSVRKWEDPVFTFGLWLPGSQGFTSSEEGNLVYGLEQKLPVFGRPELRRNVAEAAAAKERLNVRDAVERLRRDLAVALLDLALVDEEIELAQEDLEWLDATAAAVDGRYKVGKSSQVEWLRIQTERAKAANQLATNSLFRGRQQAQLNRLLNRDLESPWPRIALPVVAGPVAFDDRLAAEALNFAPGLKALQQEAAQDAAIAQLTRRQRMPEVGVGLQARQYSGDGGIREGTMTVDFSLPWLNGRHYDADFRRDQARLRAAQRDAEDFALSVRNELHHLIVDADAARRQALLYRNEIIPLAEQTLSSARSAWEGSLGLFQDVLDARRLLVENRRALAQAIAEQGRSLADITLLTGATDISASAPGDAANH